MISREWPGHVLGGISYHLSNLYSNLSRRGHEITVITGTCPQAADKLRHEAPEVKSIHPVQFGFRQGYYLLFPVAFGHFKRSFDFAPYDICITHTEVPFELPIPTISKRHDCYRATKEWIRDGLSGMKAIGDRIIDPFRRVIDRRSITAADCIIYNSAVCRAGWETAYDINTPSTISHNGIDLDTFYPDPSTGGGGYILFVGGSERKGLSKVIEFAENTGESVAIAGPEEISSSNVTALGKLSQSKLRRVYSDAEVTIHPAGWEAFGNVILESVACGTPVVATPNCGAVEVLPETACVVTSDIASGVRDAQRLSSDDCVTAAQNCSWGETAEETVDVARRITSITA
ncbi:glycosyltransferase family 4 protein [Halogeometricum salsisoli]|uniref:glycosyltransferase family 4 protein n=1 Tax=Halogeometricum salsisoli TaxID=2950536 RepID=UPI003CCD72E8